ncbi:MAG: hypothetical protein H6621_04520 [Halobacteriovoraceae bacterium]|nr:hypothetical protein [Halobacteriovoraceae bacterium]
MKKKTLAIVYTDRFAKRNFETSGLQKKLSQLGYNISTIEEPLPRKGFQKIVFALKVYIYKILMYRFFEIKKIKKHLLRIQYQHQKDLHEWDILNKKLGFPFPRSTFIFRMLNFLFKKIPAIIDINPKPDFILLTNMQNFYAQGYIKFAEKNNIPVLPLLNSWDHLTHGSQVITSSKIPFFMVWNTIHEKELTDIHQIPKNKITKVGALQFDYLTEMKQRNDLSRSKLINKYKLHSEKKILFIPAYNDRHGKYEPYVLKKIIENKDKLPVDVQIVIRPYPTDLQFSQRFSEILNLPDVHIAKLEEGIESDREAMSLLLKNSDIVLSGCGTAAIEAMFYDTNVIHVAIDPTETEQINTLAKEYFFSDHYQHIMNKEASFYTTTTEQLLNALQVYLTNPQHHQSGRLKVIEEQLFLLNQTSSEKICEVINYYESSL